MGVIGLSSTMKDIRDTQKEKLFLRTIYITFSIKLSEWGATPSPEPGGYQIVHNKNFFNRIQTDSF